MTDLGRDLADLLDPRHREDPTGRSSPAALARLASRGRWQPAPHLVLLNQKILDVVAGRIGRLLVAAPPRHGKSELVSHYTSAWYLGSFPERRVMLVGYEADFAASWGRRARDTLAEFGPGVFGVRVREDSSAANRWDLDGHRGGLITAGAGGPITGRGADLLIIDDPVKNAEDAMSEGLRQKLWDWWQSTALPRLEPGAGVILCMTRWHTDDLAGRLIRASEDGSGEPWDVLRLPAIAEEDDPLGRSVGEALWPERFDLGELAARRKALGSLWWNAEYMGRPAALEGAIFKQSWFRTWRPAADGYELTDRIAPSSECIRFAVADLAVSTKTTADYTVVGVFAVTDRAELVLLDLVRQRLEGPDQVPLLRRLYERWGPAFIGIEQVAYQLTLIQEAERTGLPIRGVVPDKDKVSRALHVAARMEAGDVYWPESAPWRGDLEEELLVFPRGRHDDQVDVLSYAARAVADDLLDPPPDIFPNWSEEEKRTAFLTAEDEEEGDDGPGIFDDVEDDF